MPKLYYLSAFCMLSLLFRTFIMLCYIGQGHDIVLQVLYHLYSLTVSDSLDNSSYSAVLYEKFLLAVVSSYLSEATLQLIFP